MATALTELASVLYEQGDLAGARQLNERALEIQRKALGPDHPSVAHCLSNLASVLRAQEDLDEAQAALLRAWRICLTRPPSFSEGTSLFYLGRLITTRDQPEAGLKLLALSYTVDNRLDHPDAEARDPPIVRQVAERLGYDEAHLQVLLEEVTTAYDAVRGRSLVATAFPEADVDGA